MSFADMKKRSKTNLSSLIKETEKISSPNTFGDTDTRYWRPELDKSGNGYAVVRFLPAPDGEELPIVEWDLHQYADMLVLKENLDPATYDAVRQALGLEALSVATAKGVEITNSVMENLQ